MPNVYRDDQLKHVKIKHEVDEKTVIINGNSPDRASKGETNRMLEEQLDTLPKNSPERKVYEKVWSGVQKYN